MLLNIYRQAVLEPRNYEANGHCRSRITPEDLIGTATVDPSTRATMNAVIACGGTGGHLFPGIAVAEVLRDRGHQVMLLVSEKEIDTLALSGSCRSSVRETADHRVCRRFIRPPMFGFLRRFNRKPFASADRIYRKFKPQVVLGMGGFTSTAPVLAGRMRGVATFHSRIERDSREKQTA